MRLLNVNTLQLQEFAEHEQPPYVITSHRWGHDEATYKDVRKGRNKDAAGFKKIQSFCKFTKEYVVKVRYGPIQWIWIDTCCIDKSSSAELTEAINSMFRWYAEAELCVAFLHDVKGGWIEADMASPPCDAIKQSVWFTRGWTLQELLAPTQVLLLDEAWRLLGHKGGEQPQILIGYPSLDLNKLLSDVTGIPRDILEDFTRAKGVSLEDKQRWMQNRITTRVEDMAYCQLGIFGVFMPLIYGERDQAMERLRAEVKRKYGEDLQDESSLKEKAQQVKEAPPAYVSQRALDSATSQLEAIAQWDYEAREENEIDFHEGERITHIMKVDVDWWHGRNEKGEEGLLPGNHVELIGSEDIDITAGKSVKTQPEQSVKKAENAGAVLDEKGAALSQSDRSETKDTATTSVEPTLNPVQEKLANLKIQAEESARLAKINREQQPKPDSLKAFRWLSGLFSTKDEPKHDGKMWVSTLPTSEQIERERAERTKRQPAKKDDISDSTAKAVPTQSITRQSTSDSKASSTTKARRARESKRTARELGKKHRTRDTVAETRGSTTTSSAPASTWAEVCYSYSAPENNEIDLTVDEIIRDIEKVDEGWWIGTNSKEERGLFPRNYVRSLQMLHDS